VCVRVNRVYLGWLQSVDVPGKWYDSFVSSFANLWVRMIVTPRDVRIENVELPIHAV
jgi:hypothetical protein